METVMALQTAVFHGEQLIPLDAVEAFLAMEPQCWVAELDGVIVGTAAAWHEGGQLHWGRFIVTKALRGRHIGTKLAAFTFAELFAQGIDSIFMEARDTTVAIVGKMGGTVAGEPSPSTKARSRPYGSREKPLPDTARKCKMDAPRNIQESIHRLRFQPRALNRPSECRSHAWLSYYELSCCDFPGQSSISMVCSTMISVISAIVLASRTFFS